MVLLVLVGLWVNAGGSNAGELLGLAGITLFSLNMVLATRAHWLEEYFSGLNDVYRKHGYLGQVALILLLFHPLLLLARYASNAKEASAFLFLSASMPRNLGILALGGMITLIVLTLYLRPKYNLWKLAHKFLGLALLMGAIHAFLIPSVVMRNELLRVYVLGFVAVGLASYLYKVFLAGKLARRYWYLVSRVDRLGDRVIEISLEAVNEKMKYRPGQFVFVSFRQVGLPGESHPFSISSAPGKKDLRLGVKAVGDYTEALVANLQKGAGAEINGPFGIFSYEDVENKNQIWIAGGIGITPFVGMLGDLLMKKDEYRIHLFYCVHDKPQGVYLDFLEEAEKKLKGRLKLTPFFSKDGRHINFNEIKRKVESINDKEILICASPKMIAALRAEFILNGVEKRRIHSEEFDF